MKRSGYSTNVCIALAMLLSASVFGQKHGLEDSNTWAHPVMQKKAIQWYDGTRIQDDAEAAIRTAVFHEVPELTGSALELDGVSTSPTGKHYRFYQTISGQRVFGAGLTANVDLNNRITLITANVYPTALANGTPLLESTTISSDDFLNASEAGVWFYNGTDLQPTIRKVIIDGYQYEEVVVDASNSVIWHRDLNLHVDTPLTIAVFNPDPLTTAQSTYMSPYLDMNDNNETVLNPLRTIKQVPGTYSNGSFKLENPWVVIQDFDSPSIPVATGVSSTFDFGRSDDRFEQGNAFYHLTAFQLYMQSLGFNLVNYQIPVDANALSGSDNSMFSRSTNPPRLFFGEGGVDDAEDADVIVHEYGHAISYSAAPNTNSGTERGCLDEANGDYLAASYSRSISSYGYDRIFSWDGHNEYWQGRNGYSNKKYTSLSFTGIYANTDIWVAAMMEIWSRLGRETTDKLLLESLYGYSVNMTMSQAAMLVVQADSSFNGGQNIQPIWESFVMYSILPSAPWSIDESQLETVRFNNTASFPTTGELNVSLNANSSYRFMLTDLSGRTLDNGTIPSGQSNWNYDGSALNNGVYIMTLINEHDKAYSEKLIRSR
ncbi:hypothetical protein [Phaeocystidibacter marisrubri]|uniref:FTP domain-containing protein n=1 Tax=Phaeocystidibacter marisrubri TaxID=1577780 RepID=A0A6L3ZIQ6_9FLAO|nr:hypothetical protein [Phaeocystidibacter marisrubri]KAB2817771.1 hypothetical protein F8C82_05030 [Phaeocystidibacter marisrubri]